MHNRDQYIPGDYVQLNGVAEKGVTYVMIDVSDSNGTKQHSFISPVSGTGSFNYGFHADMPPGNYFVTVSNDAMKNSLMTTLTVVSPENSTLTTVVLANATVTQVSSPEITQPPAVVPSRDSGSPPLAHGSDCRTLYFRWYHPCRSRREQEIIL